MDTTKPAIVALGKYQIRGVLGRGAMGTVYDGWDPVIGRRVAIKTVRMQDNGDPEAQEGLARFKNEAQAAGRLSHPNIVAVYDYGESDETAYIVMEFVEGQSLKERLDAKERFPVSETVRVMEQVLAGLQFSHDKGVIHRDIKPGNVMMTTDGQVKLADFGIARIESSVMTQAGTMLGTPAYMSPEQLMAQTVDARSDIYSSGVLLFQLLTGERPFEGGLTSIIHKALNTTPPRPSELSVTAPTSLDPVVARAMARRPADRYDSAATFARALREAAETVDNGPPDLDPGLDDEATMVAPSSRPGVMADVAPRPLPSPPGSGRRTSGLNPAALGGAAVVVAGLIGGGTWFALRSSPAEPGAAVMPSPAAPGATAPALTKAADAGSTPAASTATGSTGPAIAATASTGTGATAVASTAPAPGGTGSMGPGPANQGASDAGSAAAQAATRQPPTIPGSAADASAPPGPAPGAQAANTLHPPAVSPAEPVASPPLDVAAMRASLNAVALSAACALPRFAVSDDGAVSVSGLVGAGSPDAALRDAVQQAARAANPGAPVAWEERTIDGPYCDVLDTIHPIAEAGTPFLGLTLKDDATRLRAHELLLPVVKMPEFPAYLLVDYFSHDGSVTHLFPIRGVPAPPASSNATVRLGTSARDRVEIGPPFGTDVIVATASSVPLFPPGHVRDDETLQTYLPALKAAIETAQRGNAKLTARALTVTTVPR